MQGDYHRYLAEFQTADTRKESAAKALEAYASASTIANSDLPPTHPIRLGLALNFSVFYYEILNSPDRACHLAKQVCTSEILLKLFFAPYMFYLSYRLLTMLSPSLTHCPKNRTRTLLLSCSFFVIISLYGLLISPSKVMVMSFL